MKALISIGLLMAGMVSGCGLEPSLFAPDMEVSARRADPLMQLRHDAQREFEERDTNRDGFITSNEFAKAVGWNNQLTPRNAYEVANFNIMRGSRLQDSKADPGEYADVFVWNRLPKSQATSLELASDREFGQFDRNGDGLLDPKELAPFFARKDKHFAPQLARDLDKKRNRADGFMDSGEFHNLHVWLAVLQLVN